MKNTSSSLIKPQRISQDEIAAAAAEGVTRALAARELSMRELSEQEIADVSGGALFLKGIIAGGIRAALANQGMNFTSPALNAGLTMPGLEAGALGSTFNTMG